MVKYTYHKIYHLNHLEVYHSVVLNAFDFFFIFLNVYLSLRDRERQTMNRGGAERRGDTESKAGFRL